MADNNIIFANIVDEVSPKRPNPRQIVDLSFKNISYSISVPNTNSKKDGNLKKDGTFYYLT